MALDLTQFGSGSLAEWGDADTIPLSGDGQSVLEWPNKFPAELVWKRSPFNPLIASAIASICIEPDAKWDADAGIYDMWYGEVPNTCYASSPDGITWTKYAGNPVLTAPEGCQIPKPGVIKVGGTYYIFSSEETGSTRRIVLYSSTSKTGPFTRAGVMLSPEAGDNNFLDCPWPLELSPNSFRLYFSFGTVIVGEPQNIGYATASSPEGPWTRSGDTLLSPSGSTWYEQAVGGIRVYKLADNSYMGYVNAFGANGRSSFGRIPSADGLSFDWADAELIASPLAGSFDSAQSYRPCWTPNGPLGNTAVFYNGAPAPGIEEKIGLITFTNGVYSQWETAKRPTRNVFSGERDTVSFDGSNDSIIGLVSPTSVGTVTIVFEKTGTGNPDGGNFVDVWSSIDVNGTHGWSCGLNVATDKLVFYVANNGGYGEELVSDSPISGRTTVTFWYDGAEKRIYINGVLDAYASAEVNGISGEHWTIANRPGMDFPRNSAIDVTLFSRWQSALSDEELDEMHADIEEWLSPPAPSGNASAGSLSGFSGFRGFLGFQS